MDRTKTKLATFFNNDDEEPIPQKAVDDQKLSQYTQGTVRKSKREKEKEREEAKRREEEELAAKTYAEFIDAFEGEGSRRKGSRFVRAGSGGERAEYNPKGRGRQNEGMRAFMDDGPNREESPVPPPPRPKGKRAMDAFLEEIKREQSEREARLARSSRAQGRSVTALAAYEGQSGSKDRGDPLTSNVFVANLPQNVNEVVLGNFFAQRCGPVGSVKIMWPRGGPSYGPGTDINAARSKRAGGFSGFVSFMKRKDAETAVREMDGFDWGGSILRVGWSKAVPVAAKPAYAAYKGSESGSRSPSRGRGRSRSYSRERSNYRSRSRSLPRGYKRPRSYSLSRSRSRGRKRYYRSRSRSYSPTRPRSRSYDRRGRRYDNRSWSRSRSRSRSHGRSWRHSRSPLGHGHTGVDPDTEKFLRTVALKVKDNGEKFEDLLRERERQNPKFRFLFDPATAENRLYRALVNGEALIEGFDDEGYNSVYSTDSAEESEREHGRKNRLGRLARKRFEAMLRALTGRRGELARCMAFSLEHAEAASEVSDIIVASLLVDGTPVPRKVARLHLICDILHNSAATIPNAWKFRQEFQSRLGIVFDHLSSIYHSFPGRITAETFKKQITSVLDVWEDWIVFPPEFIEILRARLDGSSVEKEEKDGEDGEGGGEGEKKEEGRAFASKFKTSSFKPAEAAPVAAIATTTAVSSTAVSAPVAPTSLDDEGEADMDMGDSDAEDENEKKVEDDVDGIPIDDVDGEPIDGDPIDGDPIDGNPIDGEPIDGEPIDGEPVDNIDGEPIPDDDIDGIPL